MGDIFVTHAGWPFIDTVNGGSLEGVVKACEFVLGRVDAQTLIIPGHGPVADKAALATYTAKLRKAHEAIAALVAARKSVDEVVAADPLKGIEFQEAAVNKEIFIRLALEGMGKK